MTLTLKHFIHQVFILCWSEVNFVFFAIFGLGKVLWFCVTKVQAKTKVIQTYIGFVKICKLVPKVVKKTKLARYPKDQKFQEITKYSEWKKFNF